MRNNGLHLSEAYFLHSMYLMIRKLGPLYQLETVATPIKRSGNSDS